MLFSLIGQNLTEGFMNHLDVLTQRTKQFCTNKHSAPLLTGIGLFLGSIATIDQTQQIAATLGMTGITIGMFRQIVKQYREGESRMDWLLNTVMLLAVTVRSGYLFRTGQYWLMIPDLFAIIFIGIIQLQIAGYFLKRKTRQ